MQYAGGRNDVVWVSLDNRNIDVTFFLHQLEDAIRKKLPRFDFHTKDHLRFAEGKGFVPNTLSALLGAIGRRKFTLILDDVHFLTDSVAIDFLTRLVRGCPSNLTLVMASRKELWSGLFRLKMEGKIAEITRADLRFNREEAEELWGFFDEDAYTATEGWALALQSYRMLANNGKFLLPQADRNLHRYLLEEIFKQQSNEVRHFLLATAWLPELEAENCDRLLDIRNSQEILEKLVRGNIFTTQVSSTIYRYHTLFAAFLRQNSNNLGQEIVRKAMTGCFARGQYEEAADYALLIDDAAFIHDCVEAALGRPFGGGRYGNLQRYFDCMEAKKIELSPRVLLARGMYLSSRGYFYEADRCLCIALPDLNSEDRHIWLQAMIHKARILRGKVSLEESSRCIDSLLPLPGDTPMEDWYLVMIEKIHNLVLSSRFREALDLTFSMAEKCAAYGNLRVRAWYERYLTAIYFFMGDYRNCLQSYEKSLSIPPEEQDWLMRHCVGAFAAMAYQAAGQDEKAIPLMESELARLRNLGLLDELNTNYLIYAEILYWRELRNYYLESPTDLLPFYRYLDLAEEYAAVNRTTPDHLISAKVLRMNAGLLSAPEETVRCLAEVIPLVDKATPYFRAQACLGIANALNRLGQEPEKARQYYNRCIEIGQKAGCFAGPLHAFGELAIVCLREGDRDRAVEYTRQFMELSQKYGHRFYFQFKPLFAGVLKLAAEQGITPEFTREMLSYGGYAAERVYINTLGRFYIAPSHDRNTTVKIRTQKSRELLAYLLEYREGVSRDRIYADLWGDSEANVTSLFHTRRGEIRRAFESLGAKNPIVREKDVYRLNMEEITCDHDAFQEAAEEFRRQPTPENAQRVVDRYTGRYLDDLEALWAESTRLYYEDIFLTAAENLLESFQESGERAKTLELLRRCTGLSHQGHRYNPPIEGKWKKR